MAKESEKILKKLDEWLRPYMRAYYNEDADIQEKIRLKEIHTGYVRANARALAAHLGLSRDDVTLAEIMGLLHDVGRFRQYTIYRTFDDAISEDHAKLGLAVIADNALLADMEAKERALVTFAIENHNKKEIAPTKDARALCFAKILRDADKLDIYRVLEPFIAPPDGDGVTSEFLEKFVDGEQVDYTRKRTEDDRKLVRLMWAYDVNYSWTLRKIVERGYLEKIIACLPPGEAMERGIRRLRAYVAQKCAQEDERFPA